MAVPVMTEHDVLDRRGQPVRTGDLVRVEGLADAAEVQTIDPRYGVMVVLVPGRAGKMGRMVRAQEVERLGRPER